MSDQPIQESAPAAAPELPPAALPSPGAWLKQAREQAGLSIEQVAKDLYLDTQVIRAIEVDQYARVGAPVYARGYLRRYAKLVGVAETGVLARYDTLQGVPRVVDPIPVAHGSVPAPRRWIPRWLGWVLLILVISTVVIMVVQSRPDLTATLTIPFTTDSTSTVAVVPAAGQTPLARAETQAQSQSGAEVASQSMTATASSAATVPQPGSVALQLTFSGDSWVEIYDATQKAVLYEMVAEGQVREVSGMPPLKVTLGSAQGAQLAINGKVSAIPADKIQANVAHFEINAAGQIQ